MDPDKIFQDLVKELELDGVAEEYQEEILLSLAQSIQKQFLLDAYNALGKDKFDALEASVKMGEEFYATTLKHLIPEYETMCQEARKKIIDAYRNGKVPEETTVV